MSKAECDDVYYAALLHDVGKIVTPVNIINKPGRLTDKEYEIIKEHPVNGAQILETIKDYPFLARGARYHHERYDGNKLRREGNKVFLQTEILGSG
ncbi:MAG: HD domain-containing protein [Lachnospiraceae bacterium]|nr:HD domain-containing protein [Lachnospiraceae bacterium]